MIRVCAFDAYGTLFDVAAAARSAAAEPGGAILEGVWPRLAAEWRARQLAYTWLRAAAGRHADFWQVTQDALDWALEALDLREAGLRERLLALYRRLAAYPEVPAVLAELRRRGLATAILSNGTPTMLGEAAASAGIADLLDDLLSVESVGAFKPDPRVYALVPRRFGCTPSQVLFVSANGWDAAFGAAAGFATVWVNRLAEPEERLPGRPTQVIADLTPIPDLAGRL